jgi:hypothetical protein
MSLPFCRFVVSQRTCSELAPRVPDLNGGCICPTGTVTAGNECLSMSVLLLLLLLPAALLAVVLARARASHHESADDLRLRRVVEVVRIKLLLTREQGFYLGSEQPGGSWMQWCWPLDVKKQAQSLLNRSHLESAARLALWDDVDTSVFDAFCVSLRDASRRECEGVKSDLTLSSSPQFAVLGNWILDLSQSLLDPKYVGSGTAGMPQNIASSVAKENRLRIRVGSKSERVSAELATATYRSNASRRDLDEMSNGGLSWEREPAKMSSEEGEHKSSQASLFSNGMDNRNSGVIWDADRRYRYFLQTVSRIRLWADHDGILFKTLQRSQSSVVFRMYTHLHEA